MLWMMEKKDSDFRGRDAAFYVLPSDPLEACQGPLDEKRD
jgi:hypothetical protein